MDRRSVPRLELMISVAYRWRRGRQLFTGNGKMAEFSGTGALILSDSNSPPPGTRVRYECNVPAMDRLPAMIIAGVGKVQRLAAQARSGFAVRHRKLVAYVTNERASSVFAL